MSLGLVGPALGQKAGGEAAQAQAAFLAAPPWRAFVDGVGGEWTMSWCAATGTPRPG
jgi:hypothetical protein